MDKDFSKFMSQLRQTNQTLDFFCDFIKISNNVDNIKLSLCMLNSLIGTKDLRKSVETIWNRDRSAFGVMNILIAVRSEGKKMVIDTKGNCIILESMFKSVEGVIDFLEGTGLANVFREGKIKDLVDYVFGVETGLDTNARKNRSGGITEQYIDSLFTKSGIPFSKQVSSNEFPKIAKVLGVDQKVFDFVIPTPSTTYLIEVNFYSGGGSKLNETARSYTDLAPKVNSVNGFEFVWITDGIGWKSAKNKLEEAYNIIPHVYNLTTIHNFIKQIKIKH